MEMWDGFPVSLLQKFSTKQLFELSCSHKFIEPIICKMMKKITILITLILAMAGCSKEKITPEGPTDVRIRNLSDVEFTNVIVETGKGEYNYGTIASRSDSEYHRFEISYNNIEVTATIDGMVYTNGEQDHTFDVYIGPDKVSYEVYPESIGSGVLIVEVVYPYDGPITDL